MNLDHRLWYVLRVLVRFASRTKHSHIYHLGVTARDAAASLNVVRPTVHGVRVMLLYLLYTYCFIHGPDRQRVTMGHTLR